MQCEPTKPINEQLLALEALLENSSSHDMIMQKMNDMLASIDTPLLESIRAKYREEMMQAVPQAEYKYIDVVFWLYYKFRLAMELGLNDRPPVSVLDIGTGGGHFLLVCKQLGHSTLGLDIENPVYADLAEAFGVNRIFYRVEPNTPLPKFGGKFDFISAVAINFHNIYGRGPNKYWALAQWRFFLNDLMSNQLSYPGRIFLELNHERREEGMIFNPELLAMCERNGAKINKGRGQILFELSSRKRVV